MQHYDNLHWQPLLMVAGVGALVILAGIVCIIMQLVVSIRTRELRRDTTGDPWNGRTLEWSTPSPPPPWNYALLPQVKGIDAFWAMKQQARDRQAAGTQTPGYAPIEMPKNTATGFVTAFFAVVTGFALIWHIWWMAGLGLFGAFVTLLVFAWRDQEEVEIPAAEVARIDRTYRAETA
jgi:cytochrome o ubiquinol oxidase subunit 1